MFSGIYTPIVTPFKKNEDIDYDKMLHNLDRWGKTDLDGIVVLGSNGEFVYLSNGEKLELIKFVVDNFKVGKKIIAGVGCESTKETIELAKKASNLGVDAVLVLPPNYYKGAMKDDILYQHYVDVADESPVPVMIYNMPGNTGINISLSVITKLAKHPNIAGIKDTSGNIVQIAEMVRDTDDDFAVFAGNAGYLLPSLSVGARGATLALANILPEDCCKLVSLFKEGKMEQARELQLRMIEVNFAVTGRFGVPALKVALDMLGYQGGEPRRPLRRLSDANREIVRDILVRYGAINA